jgi:hypothetical protein
LDISGPGIQGQVLKVERETAPQTQGKNDTQIDLAYIEISSEASAQPGEHRIRLLTPNGVTNEIALTLSTESVVDEADVPNPIREFPLAVAGRISERGEVDTFWFHAAAGQTFTFQAKSGHGAFDPTLAIFERSPSWLDPNRMERIASNDEPLFFPGLSMDAFLVHTFAKAGVYCLRIQSATGQGSADSVYELRIFEGKGSLPGLHPKRKENSWDERMFTRKLSQTWQEELARRGALTEIPGPSEIYQPARVGSDEPLPVMRLPGTVEGRITRPAEAHRIKIRIEKAENIAIEVETPEATMPQFNPVILLFEPGGQEVATNVYTKRNNNGLYMMKMIQAKVALPLHAPGDYEMEIRDITTDCADKDFRYRVLVRRQIPHVGRIEIAEEQINLRAGTTREVNITVEREEDFRGLVTFAVEGVPEGVTVLPAAPKPVEKPPLPNGGKLERYTPIVQNSALVFVASADATPTETIKKVRVIARPMVNGNMGEPIVVKELPLAILPASTT